MCNDSPEKIAIGQTNLTVCQQRRLIPWVWEGVLADGAVTLLSAPEKIGKTTLLALLLDRRRAGGQLLGRTVYPGKTVLCSEENKRLWALRQPPLDFGPDLIYHQPPGPFPMRGRWRRFLEDLFDLCWGDEVRDLIVIDTAVSFLPLAERNKRTLRWALSTLSDIARLPAAVLVLNQSRNVHRPLAATADIVIDMSMPRGQTPTRRRTFTGVGRYPDTLQTVTADLNPEGSDYVVLPDTPAAAVPHAPLLPTLQALLGASDTPLSCRELLERWPAPAPRTDSLWRTLGRGVELFLFTVSGQGTKSEPYRFALMRPNAAGQGDGQRETAC